MSRKARTFSGILKEGVVLQELMQIIRKFIHYLSHFDLELIKRSYFSGRIAKTLPSNRPSALFTSSVAKKANSEALEGYSNHFPTDNYTKK